MAVRPNKFPFDEKKFNVCKVWIRPNVDLRLTQDRSASNAKFSKEDRNFDLCCSAAGVQPTRRQASKYQNGKGAAYTLGQQNLKANLQQEVIDFDVFIDQSQCTIETLVGTKIHEFSDQLNSEILSYTKGLFIDDSAKPEEKEEAEDKAKDVANQVSGKSSLDFANSILKNKDFNDDVSSLNKVVFKALYQAKAASTKMSKKLPPIQPSSSKFWGPYNDAVWAIHGTDDAIGLLPKSKAEVQASLKELVDFVTSSCKVQKQAHLDASKAWIDTIYTQSEEAAEA